MPHDIIDNQQTKLVDSIREILPGSQSAKFAVGYFFLSGLDSVADSLDNIVELRLLIGSSSNRETIEQIAEGYRRLEQASSALDAIAYPKRIEIEQRLDETQADVATKVAAMDHTDQGEYLVNLLVRLIVEKRLKVRVYTKGRLHAKAYIFTYAPVYDSQGRLVPRHEKGIAIVGSSNFTLSGLTHNSELNVVVHGNDNHEVLSAWFDEMWDESQDFDERLVVELRQSWPIAQITPYEIYLKTLIELVGDRLQDETAREFLWQTEITAALTDFQKNAVRRAVQIIRQFGGAFVSDVVGLGKSYIGAAIVKHFERHDHARSLIVCPAPLIRMWEHYNEAYQLNARVVSIGLLREDENHPDYNPLLDEEKYQDRDFVLIDESHNFRNTDTQRYRILQEFLQAGDRRCLLLTATPRNRDEWDIYNQIKLFHPTDRTLIPIDPPNLRDYLKLVDANKRPLAAMLSNIMVRRTRVDVLRWYGFDAETHKRVDPFNYEPFRKGDKRAYIEVAGRPQFFPKRHLETITYNIDSTYSGLYEQLLDYLGRSDLQPDDSHLKYARYGLWHYVKKDKRQVAPYNELQRAGANLRGLMRVSLFKRLESSVEAFRSTLRKMITSHQAFLTSMNQGIIPAGEEASTILSEADRYEEVDLVDALKKVSGKYLAVDFEIDRLQEDVKHDLNILKKMAALVHPIGPDKDDKLRTLIKWLYSSTNQRPPLSSEKCIIFTQFADTAQYLYENLNPKGEPSIEVIYGTNKDKALIAGRFAPKANPQHRPKGDFTEIRLLIATDVLSEGLNLQDGDRMINYDLHWNPVRLIQRFGRIDRLGTEHDSIYGFNFLPEAGIEKGLGLKERLQKRIQEIHDTLGEDAAILDPSERLNTEAFIAIYQGESIDRFEDQDDEHLVDLVEAEEFIRQLQENDPQLFERISKLRDGIRSARKDDRKGTIVVCRSGNYRQLYLLNDKGKIINREIPSVLGMMKVDPSTPALELPGDHNSKVSDTFKAFKSEVQSRLAEQKHAVSLTHAQRYILRELRKVYDQAEDDDLKSQVEALDQALRQPQTQAVRNELNAIYRSKLEGLALFDVIDKVYTRHDLRKRAERARLEEDEDTLPVIVCSLAIV